MAERPQLLAMATEIVSAHVSRNAVAVDQLPGLIQHVFTRWLPPNRQLLRHQRQNPL